VYNNGKSHHQLHQQWQQAVTNNGKGKNNAELYEQACYWYKKLDDKLNAACEEHPDKTRLELRREIENTECGGHDFITMAVAWGRGRVISEGYSPDNCSVVPRPIVDGYNPFRHQSFLSGYVDREMNMTLYNKLKEDDEHSNRIVSAIANSSR